MPMIRDANGARLIYPDYASAERRFALGGNFTVEWLAGADGSRSVTSSEEFLVVVHAAGARIAGAYGEVSADAESLALLPAGKHTLSIEGGGIAVVMATDRPDLNPAAAINAGDVPDDRIAPVTLPYRRLVPLQGPEVVAIADIPLPPDNRRLRFFQSATMSLNLVFYDGPRDRTALSPHKHADIEQGTLALRGCYVHHLRTPWGRDAGGWLDDVHLCAGPGSILLIPPELIHTTEGVGEGAHFMLDVFAPPRADFRSKGWIANAGDYAAPSEMPPS